MKNIMRKLKSKAGESLVETLVSILIFTMASIIMYSMVSAAGDINAKAKDADRANQEQMVIAEMGEGTSTEGTVKIEIFKADGTTKVGNTITEEVEIYGGSGKLYSYYKKEP